jgi:hypothetical protein
MANSPPENSDELSMYGVETSSEEPPKKKPLRENRPVPKVQETGPEVWFACRAKSGCPGKQARLLLQVKKPGGGSMLRYRCLTCKQTFSIGT